jgi:hypothetical protein
MRRGDLIMSGYVATVCAAMGVIFWLVLAPRGGDYVSARFHFDLRYPSGWQASVNNGDVPGAWVTPSTAASGTSTGGGASAPIPLVLTITRVGQQNGTGPTSSLTVTVWDLSNPTAAAQAASLAKNRTLHSAPIAGVPGFAASPTLQPLPGKAGSSTTVTDTHSDYFVVHGGYEYQLTTDIISGDNAASALQSMVASFQLTA